MNLLITGDFYVSDRYQGEDLFDPSVISLFTGADYRIVNLEAPIAVDNKRNQILKVGPHLCTSKDTILALLSKLRVDLATLANNHIMDYGLSGLRDTLMDLKSAKIDAVGAGVNLAEAAKPHILEKDGIRIAILNLADGEWETATSERPGANPLDIIENARQIREARKTNDFVIVIFHGGLEFARLPSPLLVRQLRFYAENGASAIVGHHPHCISGHEVHDGVPIFYSLGNFIFTEPSTFPDWYTGLVLRLQVQKDKDISWELIPVGQSERGYHLKPLEGEQREMTKRSIEKYSEIINDDALLNKAWRTLISDRRRFYLNIFSPMNFIQNKITRWGLFKLGADRFFLRKKHFSQILNNLGCEAHAEASKDAIKQFLGIE